MCYVDCARRDDVDPNLVHEYDENVRGIFKYGDVYGVMLETKVLLQRFYFDSDELKIEDKGQISINNDGGPLKEFKMINNRTAVYCSDLTCQVCTTSTALTPDCAAVGIEGHNIQYVSAVTNDDKLNVMTTLIRNQTSTVVHQMSDNIHNYTTEQKRPEWWTRYGRQVIGSFSRAGYAYFLGDIVVENTTIANVIFPSEFVVKLTRYCPNDASMNLGSRIDLVLTCGDTKTDNWTAVTSFDYDPEKDMLLIAFDEYYSKEKEVNPRICEFDLSELDLQYNETWTLFGQFPNLTALEQRCDKFISQYLTNGAKIPQFCFIQQYNSSCVDSDTPVVYNCDFYKTGNSIKCGNLVNYYGFPGKRLLTSTASYNFKWLKKTSDSGIMLARTSEDTLIRVSVGSSDNGTELNPTKSILAFFDPDLDEDHAFYVPEQAARSLVSYPLSCETIYTSSICSESMFLDPLKCEFCADDDGTGDAVDPGTCTRPSYSFIQTCPPSISAVTVDAVNFVIRGVILGQNVKNVEMKICGTKCAAPELGLDTIQCRILDFPGLNCYKTGNMAVYSGVLTSNNQPFSVSKKLRDSDASKFTFQPTCGQVYNSSGCVDEMFTHPQDGLKCAFCANEDGSGVAVDAGNCTRADRTFDALCPPQLLSVVVQNNTFVIKGLAMTRFVAKQAIKICDTTCQVPQVKADHVSCRLVDLPGLNCYNTSKSAVYAGALTAASEQHVYSFSVLLSNDDANRYSIPPTCEQLYTSHVCTEAMFAGSQKCEFCATDDGSGVAVGPGQCSRPADTFTEACPPVLTAVEVVGDTFVVRGVHLDRFVGEQRLDICGQECEAPEFNADSVKCGVADLPGLNCYKTDKAAVYSGVLKTSDELLEFSKLLTSQDADRFTHHPGPGDSPTPVSETTTVADPDDVDGADQSDNFYQNRFLPAVMLGLLVVLLVSVMYKCQLIKVCTDKYRNATAASSPDASRWYG